MTSRKSDKLLALLFRSNILKVFSKINPKTLTVLNYHRIENPESEKSLFKPNISASPEMFCQQLDYLKENYNVISVKQLVSWLSGHAELPPNSAMITFDDGYMDNYTNAFPELKKRNFPAVIFLASGFINQSTPFYWDLLAYSFQVSHKDNLSLGKIGKWSWENDEQKMRVAYKVIENLKIFSEDQKQVLVDKIVEDLGSPIPDMIFKQLFLSWDHIREMVNGNIEMGAHTVNHPILTRIPFDRVEDELKLSKTMIQEEINQEVVSFAYPNGQQGDFDIKVIDQIKKSGYKTAFTLISGPQRYRNVLRNPYQIRRIFLSHKDSFSRFVSKIHGLPRVLKYLGQDSG